MKSISIFSILVALIFSACTADVKKVPTRSQHPDYAYNAVIYELNTRQFTPEGTFAAAERQLPRLDSMGVDIVWVMPIQPIGQLNRKGTLGSYYAISDYCAFNPEFGTRADFESFLATAHSLGMKVILDWVANHTSPDHPWVNNPGWHLRDSLGNLVVNYDWYDIAELNYDNADMRRAMTDAITWWVDSIGVDGFRCDVAHEVPTEYWNITFANLRTTHPDLFTLCESEQPDLTESAFDMYYGWELHHLLNGVAQGQKTTADIWAYLAKSDSTFQPYAIRMNFTSNHDENSWNGTEFERMGKASDAMVALTFMLPGMPLIYTGQEFALDHRLAFFEKDTVPENYIAHPIYGTVPVKYGLYKFLADYRHTLSSLASPDHGAPLNPVDFADQRIFSFTRTASADSVFSIFNLSPDTVSVVIPQNLQSYIITDILPVQITLCPWAFVVSDTQRKNFYGGTTISSPR